MFYISNKYNYFLWNAGESVFSTPTKNDKKQKLITNIIEQQMLLVTIF